MDIKFTNNASSYIIQALTSEDTTLLLAPDTGILFPELQLDTDYFMLTLSTSEADLEIVKVIKRNADTLTIERAQEGTVARDFAINSIAEHRLTAGSLMHVLNEVLATEIVPGRIRLATEEEVLEGKVTDAAITPAQAYLFEVPINSIIMYSGAIDANGHPTNTKGEPNVNWKVCDGRYGSGTPNLQNRFIVGSSTEFPIGSVGGSNEDRVIDVDISETHDHTLTIAQMPAHSHYAYQAGGQVSDDGKNQRATYVGYNPTSSVGGSQPHKHGITPIEITVPGMPLYYALAYIMKIS